MSPARLEVHHEPGGPGLLEVHHEPAYLAEARMPTRVRVPGFALRVRVPGPAMQRMLAIAVLVLGLGIAGAATAGLLTSTGPGRYVLAAAARPAAAPHGRWATAPATSPTPLTASPGALAWPAPVTAAPRVPPPVSLTIPAIDVRTKLIRLGLTRSGGLRPPRSTAVAGWYTGSPPPGAVGAAVIAGHVDSYVGPGVFFRLRLLRPGDRIYVRQAGGRLAVFRVYSVHRYLKTRFPTGQVYGLAPTPQLRLITCGGTFDPARGSYLSNVVVYATMLSATR